MDLAISKERKQELVTLYSDLLDRSEAVILTDYVGLNVAQMTTLRNQVREVNGVYYVTKNTLIKLAMESKGMTPPADWFDGPTTIGFCFDDVSAIAKAIADFAESSDILKIKGAYLGERTVGEKDVKALANLPPMGVLQGQVLGALAAPMSGLVGVLNSALSGLVGVFEARHEQLGEGEAA